MLKQNRVSMLAAVLVLGSAALVPPASAEPTIRREGRILRVDRDNRDERRAVRLPNGDLRLPNGDIVRRNRDNDRYDRVNVRHDRDDRRVQRAVRLPNGNLRLPNGDVIRVDD